MSEHFGLVMWAACVLLGVQLPGIWRNLSEIIAEHAARRIAREETERAKARTG